MKNKSFIEMRKRKFSTRAEFVKAIGVHESTALRYERGDYDPPLEELLRFAKYLDCSIEDVVLGLLADREQ